MASTLALASQEAVGPPQADSSAIKVYELIRVNLQSNTEVI